MRDAVETTVDLWLSALNEMAGNQTLMQTTSFEPVFSCNSTTKYWKDGAVLYR